MVTNRYNDAWAKIVAAVWTEKDAEVRRRLQHDPKGVFAEFGAEFPADISVDVVQNDTDRLTFVIPVAPTDLADIRDEDIAELYQACPGTQLDLGA